MPPISKTPGPTPTRTKTPPAKQNACGPDSANTYNATIDILKRDRSPEGKKKLEDYQRKQIVLTTQTGQRACIQQSTPPGDSVHVSPPAQREGEDSSVVQNFTAAWN